MMLQNQDQFIMGGFWLNPYEVSQKPNNKARMNKQMFTVIEN